MKYGIYSKFIQDNQLFSHFTLKSEEILLKTVSL